MNKVPVKEAFQARLAESGQNLKRKAVEKLENMMKGSGYKVKRGRRKAQRVSRCRRARIESKNKRKKVSFNESKRTRRSKKKKNSQNRLKKKIGYITKRKTKPRKHKKD